ncbi:MAG TPA: choice-of-anchor Q domain-containing protein [Candidatus Paceibacterota bacterium]|nr:choice-of-anchor Q domain-containing protein [Candidatus Paceibacterota bacterium]
MPAGHVSNITDASLFVDCAGGNLRLQSNCPSVNAGNNACATNSTDLDGNPHIVSGTVDIGAYELQVST